MLFNKSHCRIYKALKGYVISQLDIDRSKKKLIETFKSFDINNDGVITIEELRDGLKNMTKFKDNDELEARVKLIMDKVDLNNNGTIEYSEFIAASIELNEMIKDSKMANLFQLLDNDKDGKIGKKDIQNIMKDITITDSMWKSFVNEYKLDSDIITIENFNNFLKI